MTSLGRGKMQMTRLSKEVKMRSGSFLTKLLSSTVLPWNVLLAEA